jgi:serine/threonine-protein kinase
MSVVVEQGLRLRSGRYELERRLGAGAAASVWLARDELLERPVAVKVLAEGLVEDRAWLARFRREARVAAGLQHPNLVSVYDFEADVERPYIVMAYMPGGSLQDRLDAGGQPDAERLAADLLRALMHIHAAGIVHRDVKPGNVLLDRDGRACLTDFGVARPQDATAITQTGEIPGTARYMAPELWRGEAATERSDLFACGVVLSQCLGDDAPGRLLGLTQRLSAEHPELRPESADAALALLAPAPGPPAPAPAEPPLQQEEWTPPPAEPPPPRSQLRRWWPVAALCAVALLAGIAIAGAIGGDDEAADPQRVAEPERDAIPPEETDTAEEPPAEEAPPADPPEVEQPEEAPPSEPATDPVALNDQGFALMNAGQYEQAIPYLEEAVQGLADTDDITYAYALYNLGRSLRLAGQPGDAIPILKKRLTIPNQLSVVEAELKRAEQDLKKLEKG